MENLRNRPIIELVVRKKLGKISQKAISSLYFRYPLSKIITASLDGRIRFYNSNSQKLVKTKVVPNKPPLHHLIKWTEKSFLVCGVSTDIHCYYAAKPYHNMKTFRMEGIVRNILKVGRNSLLITCGYSSLLVLSYSDGRVIKKFDMVRSFTDYTTFCKNIFLRRSLVVKDYFCVNLLDHRFIGFNRTSNVLIGGGILNVCGCIKLMNYKTCRRSVKKILSGSGYLDNLQSLTVFKNSRNRECLCLGRKNGIFSIEVVGSRKALIAKKPSTIFMGNRRDFKICSSDGYVTYSIFLNSKYFCVGDSKGGVSLFNLMNLNDGNSFVERSNLHANGISSLQFMKGKEWKLISCASEDVKISELYVSRGKEKMENLFFRI